MNITMEEEKIIAIFNSNSQTVLLYNILAKKGYKVVLLSAPNQISVGCTKGIRFNISDLDIIKEEIEKNKLICRGMYKRIIKDNKNTYIPIN